MTVLSDKMEEEVTIAGDKLQNTEALASIADTVKLPACIAHTRDALASKIFRFVNLILHNIPKPQDCIFAS